MTKYVIVSVSNWSEITRGIILCSSLRLGLHDEKNELVYCANCIYYTTVAEDKMVVALGSEFGGLSD